MRLDPAGTSRPGEKQGRATFLRMFLEMLTLPARSRSGTTSSARAQREPAPDGAAPRTRAEIARITARFFCASYFVVVALCWPFAAAPEGTSLGARLFSMAVLLSYPVVYLAPAWLATWLVSLAASAGARRSGMGWVRRALVWACAVGSASVTGFVLLMDRSVYELFGFHLNGFVWNLMTTPGGLESLEASESAELHTALRALGLVLLHALLLFACVRSTRLRGAAGRRLWPRVAAVFGVLLAAQALAYGASHLYGYAPVVVAAGRFPCYQPLKFRRLAARLGLGPERAPGIELAGPPRSLNYPARPLIEEPDAARPNMVWLVIESLRADALTPEIMPCTSALAERSLSCERHYSGGNGTRMGTFALFYGLHGSYWFPFLEERRPPVLMDALEQRGYRIEAWSSASFTYPEFDKTVFAGLPPERLHPHREELGKPESDRALVAQLEQTLAGRSAPQPFAAFLFFDSTHARYHFEEESVIRRPYAEDIDYSDLDLERDIEPMRNRYVNAVHDVDARVGEVVAMLERLGLSKDTLLLVTGDHGQEFLEHGRWGHNSSFCDEQLLVPFVLHVPGREPERVERITSHLDVAPTILRLLGYSQPEEDYSVGYDLFGPRARTSAVAGNWTELCWIDDEAKITLPFRGHALFGEDVRTATDEPVGDPRLVMAEKAPELRELLFEVARFGRAGARP